MLNIYAQSFLTATRTNCTTLHDVPPTNAEKRRRWWQSRRQVCVDLSKL